MDDILLCVFKYVQFKDIVNCFPVCRQFNRIANNSFYWKQSLENKFEYKLLDNNYKDKYRQFEVLDKFLSKNTKQNND